MQRTEFEASISNIPIGNTFMFIGIMFIGIVPSIIGRNTEQHIPSTFALSGSTQEQTDTIFTTLALNSVQKVGTVSLQHAFKMKCVYSLIWKSELH